MEFYCVIVAGGRGTRMGADIPKQFILIDGKPIVVHTIENFYHFDKSSKIILVLPVDQIPYWKEIEEKYPLGASVKVVSGGESRFHSVKNGLEEVPNGAIVAIHDAVRPFVAHTTIQNTIESAKVHGNGIPAIDVTDSYRIVDSMISNRAIERSNLRAIQTPQTFQSSAIKKAIEANYSESFTDDASVLEFAGNRIHLVQGNEENIKITRPFDLKLAEVLLNNKED